MGARLLFALLAIYGLFAMMAPLFARTLGRRVLILSALPPALTVLWAAAAAPRILRNEPWEGSMAAAPSFGFALSLRADAFGLLMALVVSVIGLLVFVYAYGYFSTPRDDLGKLAGALVGFAGSMLGLVISDNLFALFLFWEATSVTSYLLIGFNDKSEQSRAAALQALLTTGLGGLAMLAGFVLIGQAAGSYSLHEIVASPPTGPVVEAGLVCILVGAFTKSAQVPFHSWLPSAMAAPTPVSAYLHSATMVKAGVFLVARLTPGFESALIWRPACVAVGTATMLVGAYRALRQFDLKLLLAYGTVSQLGLMIVLFGIGSPGATFAAVVLLLAHATYKAGLFMSAGVIDRMAGTRDIRRLDGLYRRLPWLFASSAICVASMAGIPPIFGFIAKEEVFEALLGFPTKTGGIALTTAAGVAAALTVAYAGRFLTGAFGRRSRADVDTWERVTEGEPRFVTSVVDRPSLVFMVPTLVLAAFGLVSGVYTASVAWIVEPAAGALYRAAGEEHLALWHGLGMPLYVSATVLAAGTVMFAIRHLVERVQARIPRIPGSLEAYRFSLRGLLATANRATGIAQCGSLPVYLAVISLTLVAIPGVPMVMAVTSPGSGLLASTSPQGMFPSLIALLTIVSAFGVTMAARRFPAVLMLGGVGYGVGVLFVAQGAPDLALTQFLIETLMLIIFVLVLRRLPMNFAPTRLRGYVPVRMLVAGLVGAFVFLFTLAAVGARELPSISSEYLARSLPEAHGRNVVNLILVDFRALDTMGEITVLAVAAIGIASLVLASRGQVRGGGQGVA